MKEPLSNSLRHELGAIKAAGPHPDADLLTGFAEGTLTTREREGVLAHLAACAECRDVVGMATGAAPEPVTTAPQLVAKPIRPPLRSWLPWVATAASVVVVCSAVLLHELPRRSTEKLVATPASSVQPEKNAPMRQVPAVADRPTSEPASIADQRTARVATPMSSAKDAKAKAAPAPQVSVAENKPKEQTTRTEQVTVQAQAGAVHTTESADVKSLPINGRSYGALTGGVAKTQAATPPPSQRLGLGNSVQMNQAQNAQSVAADGLNADKRTRTNTGQVAGAQVSQAAPPVRGDVADNTYAAETQSLPTFAAAAPTVSKVARASGGALRPHWRIDENGKLQRSFGNGEWSNLLETEKARFRVVAVIGQEIWAGGDESRLYHSSDNGAGWNRIKLPKKNGGKHVITRIQFQTAFAGMVESEDGTQWLTDDGGKNWR